MGIGLNILQAVISYRNPLLNELMIDFTVFGSVTFIGLLILAAYLHNNNRLSYRMIFAVGVGGVITYGLKEFVARPRPGESILPYAATSYAFPSGHTTLAFAAATILAAEYRDRWFTAFLYLIAGMVGFSRIYLGVHYPGDVLTGALVGVLAGLFTVQYGPIIREYLLAKAGY